MSYDSTVGTENAVNTCGTCKHFGKRVDYFDRPNEVPTPPHYHICDFINDIPKKKGVAAFTIDASWYWSCLCVSDEFGCNQWKSK